MKIYWSVSLFLMHKKHKPVSAAYTMDKSFIKHTYPTCCQPVHTCFHHQKRTNLHHSVFCVSHLLHVSFLETNELGVVGCWEIGQSLKSETYMLAL